MGGQVLFTIQCMMMVWLFYKYIIYWLFWHIKTIDLLLAMAFFVFYNRGIFKYGDDMVSTGMTKLNVHVEDDSFSR